MLDTSLRMQNAMEQAHRCWARAVNVSPAFVEKTYPYVNSYCFLARKCRVTSSGDTANEMGL